MEREFDYNPEYVENLKEKVDRAAKQLEDALAGVAMPPIWDDKDNMVAALAILVGSERARTAMLKRMELKRQESESKRLLRRLIEVWTG